MSHISGVYYVIPRERVSHEVIGVGAQTRHVAGTCIYVYLKAGTPQCFLSSEFQGRVGLKNPGQGSAWEGSGSS
jgi:hypothetical protein